MSAMYMESRNSLTVLKFESIAKARWPIRHAISTRHGGVSTRPYESLNIGFRPGDDPRNVVENRRRLCEAIDVPSDRFVSASLSHLANVKVIEPDTAFGGFATPGTGAPNVDALVTALDRTTLFVTSADCSLTLLFDPVHVVLAVIHAGWQSAVLNIHANVIRTMQLRFGTDPEQLFAGVGPLISGDAYDVPRSRIALLTKVYGEEVASQFWREQGGRVFLDIEKLLTHQLRALGVTAVETSQFTTDKHTDLLFSARAEGETGRFALVAAIDHSLQGTSDV
ncbi:MAG: polyphenol oxidase family protein [Thermoanaerobaculia bacterium]